MKPPSRNQYSPKTTPAPASPAAPAPAPPAAPVPPAVPKVMFRNRKHYVVTVQILGKDGRTHANEIYAGSHLVWPQMPDYGPDIALKLRHGHLTVSPFVTGQ